MNKGKIYKMENEYGIYYGSTTRSLEQRLSSHKHEAKTKNGSNKILFQNGCIPKIELIEEVHFDDIKELRERERYYIENFECINKQIPNRTQKEYYQKNKDKYSYEPNKDRINEYYQKKKEQILKQQKEHYQKNKEQILKLQKEHYQKIKDKKKEYYQDNKDIISKKNKEYYQRKKAQAKQVYDFLTQIENSQNILV